MSRNLLLIEDDKKKIEDIKSFIRGEFPDYKLSSKESYQTGMKELIMQRFDLLLLDCAIRSCRKL